METFRRETGAVFGAGGRFGLFPTGSADANAVENARRRVSFRKSLHSIHRFTVISEDGRSGKVMGGYGGPFSASKSRVFGRKTIDLVGMERKDTRHSRRVRGNSIL